MLKLRSTKLMCLLIAFIWTTVIIGSSYAYFIDSVTVTGNVVATGNLKAAMSWKNPGETTWKDASEGAIFNHQRWEPGYTDVKYIKVDNTGSLAFQYELNVFPAELLTGRANLLEVIDVYYGEGVTGVTRANYATELTRVGTLMDLLTNANGAAYGILLPEEGKGSNNAELPAGVKASTGSVEACMVLHMQEEAGNEYMGLSVGDGFKVQLYATQYMYENDSFGNTYDQEAELPVLNIPTSMIIEVTPVNGLVPYDVWFNDPANGVSATVPAGAKMADGATSLKLVVEAKNKSEANVSLTREEELFAYNVKVEGLASDNTVPVVINMGEVLPNGLNLGNYSLYHVEDGNTVLMTLVDSAADLNAHNEFTYDPINGAVAVAMATFSEVALVADTTKAWEGKFDYSWYTNAVALAEGEADYIIANADQLAAFSAIVGGMNGQTQDSFKEKTVKLVADVNLGDAEKGNNPDIIFYPIGYNSADGKYEKTGVAVSTGFYTFEGTFDGNGHTISNFYQNTWEMKGDNNYYDATLQYYRDGMGLFGKVYGGTVKNLTVENFKSDGEYTTTGVIAAYADGATFENIAIIDCNPRVYNTGNGGIVGCVGWYAKEANLKTTFTNITVDNSNKISALWGSWDVACGGLVGQYYPNSGQTSAGTPKNAGVHFENCHVSAQIDVYNDVCANYQYYAYRYAGMIIGSIRENTTNADGKTIPNMAGIAATGCTVNYGTWNDYYYCEFEKNTMASYSEDYQFSRVPHSELNFTDSNGNGIIDTVEERNSVTGCKHTHTKEEDKQAVYLPFHQLFTGYSWGVSSIGLEKYSGIVTDLGITEGEQEESVQKFTVRKDIKIAEKTPIQISELFAAIENLPAGIIINSNSVYVSVTALNNSGITGAFVADASGWENGTLTLNKVEGLAKVTIQDYQFCKPTSFLLKDGALFDVFSVKFPNVDEYLYRVGNVNAVTLGTLFTTAPGDIGLGNVTVEVENVAGSAAKNVVKAAASKWSSTEIKFAGTGVVKVTISDDVYNMPTELYLEVVDAENITSAAGATDKNFVLLNDVTYTGGYLYYKNSTLYGNGFTIDITGAAHSDLKNASDTNSNKSAYCNIWMVDSRFDNVKVKGRVYPEVGMTADSDYGNAAIRTEGTCYITNSYISNCRVPLRVQGNTTLKNTVVDGGRYANVELRSGKLTLDGVTTINTVRKGSNGTTDVIGFGIVIHSEAANASIAVIGDGLKQYNWVGKNEHQETLSGDTYLLSAYNLVFHANNSDTIYFDYGNDQFVNTGILCLCADMNKDVVTGLDDRYSQVVSGYDAWVLTYDNRNSKHTDWFDESVNVVTVEADHKQYPVIPNYNGNEAQTVEFTKGETYYFDTSVLTAEKFGQILTISSVAMNGTTYNYGDKIPFTEGGVYEIVYTVDDPYIYNADGSTGDKFTHNVGITVTAIAKDAEILAPKFTFIDQNGNKYESTTVKVGDKTYVMPNVTAADPTTNSMSSINIGSASISGTTVYFPVATGYTERSGSNFNRYYPLFNGINITDYTIAGDTTGTTYTTSGNYTSLVGSSGTKFIIPANGGQTNCGDYVKTNGQTGNAAGNTDSGWQGAGYSTSYGGTYLKSGNTNASNGAGSNGYERIVWVEYCFNAGNGDVYYYRIGYHCNKKDAQSCVTPDTLVTLADGSKKEIQHVTYEDQLLVWDFYKGEYAVAPAAIIFNHGVGENTVIAMTFDDGTVVKVTNMHLFVDADTNSFVMVDADNASSYIGHGFVKRDGNDYKTVKLVDVDITQETIGAYGIISAGHYNILVEDMFSADYEPQDVKLFTYFDIGDNMKYDEQRMQADIEKYGLYTYEEFSDYLTYELFEAFNVKYMKVVVGKGEYTYEGILQLIEEYLK